MCTPADRSSFLFIALFADNNVKRIVQNVCTDVRSWRACAHTHVNHPYVSGEICCCSSDQFNYKVSIVIRQLNDDAAGSRKSTLVCRDDPAESHKAPFTSPTNIDQQQKNVKKIVEMCDAKKSECLHCDRTFFYGCDAYRIRTFFSAHIFSMMRFNYAILHRCVKWQFSVRAQCSANWPP